MKCSKVEYGGSGSSSFVYQRRPFSSSCSSSFVDELLPTGSEEREVLGVGSIPVPILRSCQNMKIIALQLHNMNMVG